MTKTRYRLGKDGWIFRKPVLILQVLKKYDDGPLAPDGLPWHLAGERWRDATVEDLQTMENHNEQ